ncbi:MAG: 4'-phosphopantetheinyl transferase superfamily protein [Actinomycetales bacterium]
MTSAWPHAPGNPVFPIIRQVDLPIDEIDINVLQDRCRALLHPAEQVTSQQFTGSRRTEWLLGRVAIKESVRDWQSTMGHPVVPSEQIEVGIDERGAPRVRTPGSRAPEVSLAHTRVTADSGRLAHVGLVLAAASSPGMRVGVDVEALDRPLPALNRLLDERERALIDGECGAIGLLVAKEAAAKAAGTGLQGSLSRWPIHSRQGPLVLVGDEVDQRRWVHVTTTGRWVVGVCSSAWISSAWFSG